MNSQQSPPVAVKNDQQKQLPCLLLQLPPEMRNNIWIMLLSSTRLSHGKRDGWDWIKPAPHSLAILRVCKQIYNETKSLWLRHVLFNFEETKTMLDKLSVLPMPILSHIRHVRLVDTGIMSHPPGRAPWDFEEFNTAAAFMLLPGLRLERLTLIRPAWLDDPGGAYDSVRNMVEKGNGWRELHFISPCSSLLGFEPSWGVIRKPQPTNWKSNLHKRDGVDSGASVIIYQSTVTDAPNTVMNPSTRKVFEQQVTSPTELETFGLSEDQSLTAEKKALLVIVKRGRKANIAKPDEPSDEPADATDGEDELRTFADIRLRLPNLSWPEISQTLGIMMSDREDEAQNPSDEPVFHTDNYNDVDEYEWDTNKVKMNLTLSGSAGGML